MVDEAVMAGCAVRSPIDKAVEQLVECSDPRKVGAVDGGRLARLEGGVSGRGDEG